MLLDQTTVIARRLDSLPAFGEIQIPGKGRGRCKDYAIHYTITAVHFTKRSGPRRALGDRRFIFCEGWALASMMASTDDTASSPPSGCRKLSYLAGAQEGIKRIHVKLYGSVSTTLILPPFRAKKADWG